MNPKLALTTSGWILLGTMIGLTATLLLNRVMGSTGALVMLVVPPLAAMIPADRYRKKGIYLSISTRLLAVVLFLIFLSGVIVLSIVVAGTPLAGSWPIYVFALLFEGAMIFASLSFFTFKGEKNRT